MGIGMGLSGESWKDKEPPWLIRVNVMENAEGRLEVAPERFTVGVGDWVEFYAAAPAPPNNQERPYKVEVEIQGEAVERIASVRPAKLMVGNFFGFGRNAENHPIMAPFTSSVPAIEVTERHFFLRGKSAGKAIIKSTVARGGTWKEVRELEVTVAEQREVPPEPQGPRGFQ